MEPGKRSCAQAIGNVPVQALRRRRKASGTAQTSNSAKVPGSGTLIEPLVMIVVAAPGKSESPLRVPANLSAQTPSLKPVVSKVTVAMIPFAAIVPVLVVVVAS